MGTAVILRIASCKITSTQFQALVEFQNTAAGFVFLGLFFVRTASTLLILAYLTWG
jgi:hypothetical protein